ncbi:MAG TPA: methyltransferase domain-containing protein [Terriglobia bacterium]|nr:methyltransferase domain-containing protein [Terriglobia bacterium]
MTACPCCHHSESRFFGTLGDRLFRTTPKKFDLYECRRCGVVFLSPSPQETELAAYYPCGYWWQTTAGPVRFGFWHKALETYRRWLISGQVRRIARLVAKSSSRPVRLLDVGCGDGLFLAACERMPCLRLGIDQSFPAAAMARARGSMEAAQGRVDVLPFASGSVDLVTMFHVLEHLARPQECLQEVRRVLNADGVFVAQVPNSASLQRRLFGRRWAGFDVPRHLVNYSSASLRNLLESNGFHVMHMSYFSWRDNPAIPIMSLFPRLYPPARRLWNSTSKGSSASDSLLDLAFLLLVLLASPLAFGESLVGRGGTVIAVAQRV